MGAHRTYACVARSLLLICFLRGTGDLRTLFGRVRSLTLIGQMLFDIEVDCVLVGFDTKNGIIEFRLAPGILTLLIENTDLHYFSTIRNPFLGPGTEPLIMSRFFSSSTFMMVRFWTVVFALPIRPAIRIPLKTRMDPNPPDGTRCSEPVVLAVCRLAYTGKSVALDNALKSLTLGGADHIDKLPFLEDPNADLVSELQVFNSFPVLIFADHALGRSSCFLEMAFECRWGVLFLAFDCGDLQGAVSIDILGTNLGYHIGHRLDHGTRNVFTLFVEDAGHSYFFPNERWHSFYVLNFDFYFYTAGQLELHQGVDRLG